MSTHLALFICGGAGGNALSSVLMTIKLPHRPIPCRKESVSVWNLLAIRHSIINVLQRVILFNYEIAEKGLFSLMHNGYGSWRELQLMLGNYGCYT